MQHALLLASHLTTWAIPQTFAARIVTYQPETISDHFEDWIVGYTNHEQQPVPIVKLEPHPPTNDRALFIESDHPFMICCGAVSRPQQIIGHKEDYPPIEADIPAFLINGIQTNEGVYPALDVDRTSKLLSGSIA